MQVHNLKHGLGGHVRFGRYATGEIAMQIVDLEVCDLVANATVNIVQWGAPRAPEGHVWVKTWSENEGMADALVAAGVIEARITETARGGYEGRCVAILGKLTPAALAELAEQERTRT